MTDKEKADCLIEIHNTQMEHYMQTREIEFRVNLAIWTLIAFAGWALYGNLRLVSVIAWIIYILLAMAVYAGHIFLWMIPIKNSEDKDDHYILQYRKAVEELADVTVEKYIRKTHFTKLQGMLERFGTSGWSWILSQTGITLILLIGLGILLSSA